MRAPRRGAAREAKKRCAPQSSPYCASNLPYLLPARNFPWLTHQILLSSSLALVVVSLNRLHTRCKFSTSALALSLTSSRSHSHAIQTPTSRAVLKQTSAIVRTIARTRPHISISARQDLARSPACPIKQLLEDTHATQQRNTERAAVFPC
eukprot:4817961-Pleurochrysis_carterae.AAC.2